MKTSLDPRHKRRQEVIQKLFAESFFHQPTKNTTLLKIISNLKSIDRSITKVAPEFPIDKVNKIDLAILRLSVFELLVEKKEPPKVIIDEAIELAKEFGGDASPAFINGALGKLLKKHETT